MDGNMRIHSDSHYLKTLAEFVRLRSLAEALRTVSQYACPSTPGFPNNQQRIVIERFGEEPF
jgi:hypothetical protein